MMKLKVLASGSKGNCYLLGNESETLILEAGINEKQILSGLNYDLTNVLGCLVTHEHKDHCKSVEKLIDKGINIYASAGTFEKIGVKNHRTHVVKSEHSFQIGKFTIVPFDVKHDCEEPLGFLIHHEEIGRLLFITDTYYCEYNFKSLNHILIECNYSKDILDENIKNGAIPKSLRNRIVQSHFEINNVIDFLNASDISELENMMIIHLSDSNSDEALFKEEVAKKVGIPVAVARPGVEIYL